MMVSRTRNFAMLEIYLLECEIGSTIISDEWKIQCIPAELSVNHPTVCHRRYFVDPNNNFIHTQNIKNNWRYFKNLFSQVNTFE